LIIGIGLHGYSSFRFVPILVIVIFFINFYYQKKVEGKEQSIVLLVLIGLTALAAFLPLFRYWFDNPTSFGYRALSRLTQIERPFDRPAIIIFIKNIFDSIFMPFYNNGQIWVHSVINRPALDFVSAGCLFTGMIFFIKKYIYNKDWESAALLCSIPLLMMPSILSLAYPGENPSLNRSAGALVPIFVIAGVGFYQFLCSIKRINQNKWMISITVLAACVLISFSTISNFQLVFIDYKEQFDRNAWNSSEMGQVIEDFIHDGNNPDDAYVIPFPHWVDTRLVGFNANYPGKDYALQRENIPTTANLEGNKLFLYKPEDTETQHALEDVYPAGETAIFYSKILGKEFIIYTVEEHK